MSIPLPYFAKALFEYKAVEDTELSIAKGDFMTVEEINDTGWCLAKHTDGRAGWLPVDYVEQTDAIPAQADTTPSQPSAPSPVPEPVRADEEMAGALKSLSVSAAAEPAPSSGNVVEMGSAAGAASGDSKGCHQCRQPIVGAFVVAKDWSFHPDCFTCATCKTALGGKPFIEKDDKFFCEEDYYASFNPKCGACDEVIKGQYISALGKSWHPEHFVCTTCKAPFEGSQFRKHEDRPYCEEHFTQLFAVPCAKCGQNISGQVFQAMDKKYHLDCFVCVVGDHKIGESGNFHMHENKIYCPTHFDELVLNRCSGCKNLIRGPYIKIMENFYHPDCWKCADCKVTLKADTCAQLKSVFYCKPCHAKARTAADAAPASAAPQTASLVDPGEQRAKEALAKVQADKEAKARAAAEEAARAEEAKKKLEAEKKTGVFTYFEVPYDQLITSDPSKLPAGVDPSKKELYLSDAIFQAKFKMDKASFAKKPKWQQDNLKKELKLF